MDMRINRAFPCHIMAFEGACPERAIARGYDYNGVGFACSGCGIWRQAS